MTKNLFIFCAFIFLFTINSFAQVCGDDSIYNNLKQDPRLNLSAESAFVRNVQRWRTINYNYQVLNDPTQSFTGGSNCTEVNYIIPVIVHIVHRPGKSIGTDENIDTAQVINQIDRLNYVFRNGHTSSINTGIQFELAKKLPNGTTTSGIVRHASHRYDTVSLHNDSLDLIRAEYNYDESKYLNIYVVNKIVNPDLSPSNVAGYSSYPWSIGVTNQGVVIEYDKFGHYLFGSPVIGNSEGELLVHEIGHYLGLYHPWQEQCNGDDTTTCDVSGDLCCDVPQSSGELISCTIQNTCPASSDTDAIYNFMSYTQDGCTDQFTFNQLEIMLATLSTYRKDLAKPVNVNQLDISSCYWTARFEGPSLICEEDELIFEAYDLGSQVSYRWIYYNVSSPSNKYYLSGTHIGRFTGLNPGYYNFTLEVSQGNDTIRYSNPFELEVVTCEKLKSTKSSWLFGNEAGIAFYENGKVKRDINPMLNSPNIQSYEGSLSISDSLGSLEFYSGGHDLSTQGESSGLKVFGDNYRPVKNDTIIGATSSSQSMIAIPFHTNSSLYHIFTRGFSDTGLNIFHHHIIDVDSNSGFAHGAIISKDEVIYDDNNVQAGPSELISAIKRCDDSTYWLLTTNSDSSSIEFYIVNDDSVYFSHRTIFFVSDSDATAHVGFIKFSPDGNWVWILNSLFKFCRSEGSLELVYVDSLNTYDLFHGVAFSPNSLKMYTSSATYLHGYKNSSSSYDHALYQYDLSKNNIKDSRVRVKELNEQPLIFDYYRSLQLGPDGKIYLSAYNQTNLGVINVPNKKVYLNNECDFQNIGPYTSIGGDGGVCQSGLPNFIDAHDPSDVIGTISIRRLSCFEREFIPSTCCASSYKWLFGDGDSSLSRISYHEYDSSGDYTVSLIIGEDTTEINVTVGLSEAVKIYGRKILCTDSLPLDYSSNQSQYFNHNWILENGQIIGSGKNIQINWEQAGSLKLIVEDTSYCVDSAFINVNYIDSVELDFTIEQINCNKFRFSTENYCDSTITWILDDTSLINVSFFSYEFDDTSSYQVSLILANDTVSKYVTSGISSQFKDLQGDSTFCSSDTFEYSVLYNSDFIYQWQISGHKYLDSFNNSIAIQWMEEGMVLLILENTSTNCIDSVSLIVKPDISDSLNFTYEISSCFIADFHSENFCGLDRIWYFGDGDSSTEQSPTHTYSSYGVFPVELHINNTVIYDTIRIETGPNPIIQGNDSVCFQSSGNQFTLNNYSSQDSFAWTVQYGTIDAYFDDGKTVNVTVSNSGYLKVYYTNSIECTDSSALYISMYEDLTNNIWFEDSINIFCSADSSSYILGDNPSGGNGTYTYSWYNSQDGVQYNLVPGANSSTLYLTDTVYNDYYYRVVNSNTCSKSSNILFVNVVFPKNQIQIINPPCIIGDTIEALGNALDIVDINNHATVPLKYSWFYSSDLISWTEYGPDSCHTNDSNYLTWSKVNADSIGYLYRKITLFNYYDCITHSDTVKISPELFIIQQPEDFNVCGSGVRTVNFRIILHGNISDSLTTIKGMYKKQGDPSFAYVGTGDSISFDTNFINGETWVFKFEINSTCGLFYSENAYTHVEVQPPQVFSQPSSQSGNLGSEITFSGNFTGNYNKYQWQIKKATEDTWQNIQGATDSILSYIGYNICDSASYIRVKISNSCGTVYSDSSAQVFLSDPTDIWIKDSWNDVGNEPSQDSSVFRSPDIWNRLDSSTTYVHQNPEYSQSNYNYLNIKVRNDSASSDSSFETPLYLYWTFASVDGEEWITKWVDVPNNQFVDSSSTPFDSFPMGSQINYEPIIVPRIAPGDSLIITYPWQPPNPANYKWRRIQGQAPYADDEINVCLLARLEHCSDYPHKMAIPEYLNYEVKPNVINNNNIATRNMWVQDSLSEFGGFEGPWVNAGMDTMGTIKIKIGGLDDSFSDYWDIKVLLDDLLGNAFDASSNQMDGFIRVLPTEHQYLLIADSFGLFKNISIDDTLQSHLRIDIEPKVPLDQIPNMDYIVSIQQFNNSDINYIGECFVMFTKTANDNYRIFNSKTRDFDYSQLQDTLYVSNWDNIDTTGIKVYPNPTFNKLNIKVGSNKSQIIESSIIDQGGNIILTKKLACKVGENYFDYDMTSLSSGMYFLRLNNNANSETFNIIKLSK